MSNQTRNNKKKIMRKHKGHDKQHRLATADPQVRRTIQILRGDWHNITAVQRGDRVLQLLDKGCTRRGLGKDLHVSDKIVRLAVAAAHLSEHYRQMIERGTSAKRVLAFARADKRISRRDLRLEQEQRTGGPSTHLSNQLARFVLTQCTDMCCRGTVDVFLDEVGRELWVRGFRPGGSGYNYRPPSIGQECGFRRAVQLAWQKPEKDWIWPEECIQAVASFAMIMEAEKIIRNNAIAKMSKMVCCLQLEVDDVDPTRQEAKALSPRTLGKRLRELSQKEFRSSARPSLVA